MGARQVWLVLSALAYACDAASSGAKICDALNVCNFRKFNFSCPTGMQLVAAPTRNDNYTFRTADTPYAERAHDPTTYTPGVLNELHLRVMHPRWKYIGLLLYAVQAGEGYIDEDENLIETPIGEWDVSSAPDEFYISPACGARAVTHLNANAKRMHHRFHWRAPTGLGRVTFRLLLKWGETNGGNFYWPMTAGDLTLDEGAIVPGANASASAAAAPASVTCDEACAARAAARARGALAAAAASTDEFVEHMAPSRVCPAARAEGLRVRVDAARARASGMKLRPLFSQVGAGRGRACYHYDSTARGARQRQRDRRRRARAAARMRRSARRAVLTRRDRRGRRRHGAAVRVLVRGVPDARRVVASDPAPSPVPTSVELVPTPGRQVPHLCARPVRTSGTTVMLDDTLANPTRSRLSSAGEHATISRCCNGTLHRSPSSRPTYIARTDWRARCSVRPNTSLARARGQLSKVLLGGERWSRTSRARSLTSSAASSRTPIRR